MNKHEHSWNYSIVLWTKEGHRAYPCRGCPALNVFGSIETLVA